MSLCRYCNEDHYPNYLCPAKLNAGIDTRDLNKIVNRFIKYVVAQRDSASGNVKRSSSMEDAVYHMGEEHAYEFYLENLSKPYMYLKSVQTELLGRMGDNIAEYEDDYTEGIAEAVTDIQQWADYN